MRAAIAAVCLLAAGVRGAVCSNFDCLYRIDEGFFFDNIWIRTLATYYDQDATTLPRSCNTSNWLSYFGCAAKCPVAFELTAPPEAAGLRLCLTDNEFEGGADLLHSDHALIGRELELAAAPATNSGGCTADRLDGVRGRVALLKAGGCDYVEQAANAGRSGAVATIIVNDRVSLLAEDTWFQKNGMGGAAPSGGLNVTMLVSRGLGQPVLDLAAAGVQFRGRFVMECDGGSPQVAVAEMKGNWDSCPRPDDLHCSQWAAKQGWGDGDLDALCTGCMLEAVIDGDDNDTICLYSSEMLPFREENSLLAAGAVVQEFDVRLAGTECRDGSGADPWTGLTCEFLAQMVVWYGVSCSGLAGMIGPQSMDWFARTCQKSCNPACAQIDCPTSAIAGASGQLVFVVSVGRECEREVVRAAAEAGVGAVVLPQKHVGASLGVGVPVHRVLPSDMDRVVAAAERVNGKALRMRVRPAARGAQSNSSRPPKASGALLAEPTLVSASGFTFTWPVVLCIACAVVLAALNAGIFVRQRRVSVRVARTEATTFRLPLSIASIGIGVSLLLCCTTVTFVLAYQAGKETTDMALDEGWEAVSDTQRKAGAVVTVMRDQLMTAYATIAELGIQRVLGVGVAVGQRLARLFRDHTDESGAEYFERVTRIVGDVTFTEGSFTQADQWRFMFRSVKGYFGGPGLKTVVGDNGTLLVMTESPLSGAKQITPPSVYDPMRCFGRQYGSALDLTKDLRESSYVWSVCQRPLPTTKRVFELIGRRPLSVLLPMYNSAGENVGVMEGMNDLRWIHEVLAQYLSTPEVANMTLVLLEAESGGIVGSTLGGRDQRITSEYSRAIGPDEDLLTEPLTLATMPVFELVAVDAFLRATYGGLGGGLGVVHELDQAEWYAKSGQQPVRAIHVTFDGGEAVDESDSKWRMRLGGGSSVVDGRGGRCLDVDGTSSLEVYRNLSTDLPRVRDGRNVTSPRFNAAWNHTRWMGDTEVVVVPDQDPAEETAPLEWFPLMREPVMGRQHTLAMWVRPRRAFTEAELDLSFGPSLWTDELSATSALRVTAAGRMVVRSSFDVGCSTAPYPGGLPVGVWTHVTAQLDIWKVRHTLKRQGRPLGEQLYAQMCRVYINGSLHSEHPVAQSIQTLDTVAKRSSPYRVGHGFDGQIDDVVLYNATLSAGEVRQLAETGALKRVAPSRRFYALVSKFAEEGLRWLTLVTLPRDDVMREVDRLNELQRHNQGVRRDNIEKELSQRSVETVLATVVIALASVAVFLLCNEALTRPIGKLALQLLEVSVMQVDGVGEERSWIEEVDAMHVAMSVVATNLREYKQYLPQSLLVGAEEDVQSVDSGTEHSEQLPRRPSGRVTVHAADGSSEVSNSTGRGSSSNGSTGAQVVVNTVHQHLQHRAASLGVINVVGHRHFVREHRVQSVAAFHDEYLQQILSAVSGAKGIVDVFVGDRVSVSFNAVRRCTEHRLVAVSTLMQVTERTVAKDRKLSGSAATGGALCGSLGTLGLRRFSVIGSVATAAAMYERVCVQHRLRLLVDDALRMDTEGCMHYRLAECVIFPKLSQRACYMFEARAAVEAPRGDDQDEWMYCLEVREGRAKELNPWTRYNEAQRVRWSGGSAASILQELEAAATGQQAGDDELRHRDHREQQLRELVQAASPDDLRPKLVAEVGGPLADSSPPLAAKAVTSPRCDGLQVEDV